MRIAGILSGLACLFLAAGCCSTGLSDLSPETAKRLHQVARTLHDIPVYQIVMNDLEPGSAVLLDERTLLTCKHLLVRKAEKLSIRRTPDKEWVEVGVTPLCQGETDSIEDDWVLYRLDTGVKLPNSPVPSDFDYEPREGDEVLLTGYPGRGERPDVVSAMPGTVVRDQPVPWYLWLLGKRGPRENWAVYIDIGRRRAREVRGYSGGAAVVFDAYGCKPRVIGINRGYSGFRVLGREVACVTVVRRLPEEVKQFLVRESEPE